MIRSLFIHNLIPKTTTFVSVNLYRTHLRISELNGASILREPVRFYCVKSIKSPVDIEQLSGVSYLNQRLIKLEQLENPSSLAIEEINQKLIKLQSDITGNNKFVNDKLSLLQNNDEKIIENIKKLELKIVLANAHKDFKTYHQTHRENREEIGDYTFIGKFLGGIMACAIIYMLVTGLQAEFEHRLKKKDSNLE